MNKTININLANTFFHIDEDAYNKLQRYLEAIKRSFTNSQGRDEIISDIEARIAELFAERIKNERQVITVKEVEEVIAIMGQPEDYLVDEEIFDDQPKAKKATQTRREYKQLFRDIDNKYVGGVSSGLGHYLGIDAIWVRLLWIILAFASGFTFVFIYILFWILVPEASTTAQKLAMKGQAVNISNIEKKIKEGFDDVADKVKGVDYEKVGSKVKSSSKTFFDTIGDIILFLFKVFAKFIGIILLIVAASVLIGLFIGLFTAGTVDVIDGGQPWSEFVNVAVDAPIWLLSILIFLAVGIPFFFLFYLGLKILVNNLKSMGNIAKFTLLGLWLLSVIGLIIFGVRTAADHAYQRSTSTTEQIYFNTLDTLTVKMAKNDTFEHRYYKSDFDIVRDGNERKLYSENVRYNIKQSEDSLAYVKVTKEAEGRNYDDATTTASEIEYAYVLQGNVLSLNEYLTTDFDNKFRDQKVMVTLYIPKGVTIKLHNSSYGYIGSGTDNDRDYYRSNIVNHIWKMEDGELKCLDCSDAADPEDESENNHIRIDRDGIDINIEDNGDEFRMKLDEDGVKIKTT